MRLRTCISIMLIALFLFATGCGKQSYDIDPGMEPFAAFFSNEAPLVDVSGKQTKTSPEQMRMLAFGAVLATRNDHGFEMLATHGPDDSAYRLNRQVRGVESDWGISDRESALETIGRMQSRGHRSTTSNSTGYNELYQAILHGQDINTRGWVFLDDAEAAVSGVYAELIQKFGYTREELQAIGTLSAWDYDRIVTLSRWCYTFGYITEEECLGYVQWAAEQAVLEYEGWRGYFAAVMAGRAIWAGRSYLEGYDVTIGNKLLQSHDSIYQTVSFHADGTAHKPYTAPAQAAAFFDALFAERPESIAYENYKCEFQEDGMLEIVQYVGTGTELTIPAEVDGYPVRAIGRKVFEERTDLTSVLIPEGILSIGEGAFDQCTSLAAVTLPHSLLSIDEYAFRNCALERLELPAALTTIGGRAFLACERLTEVAIPASITKLGWGAFYGCTALATVTIPGSVAGMEGGVFYDTPWLNTQTDEYIIVGDGHYIYLGANPEVTVPGGIRSIDFLFNDNVANVALPHSMPTINGYAFYGCESLEKADIPNTVTEIGDEAFRGCVALKEAIIPSGVAAIGEGAFRGCASLREIKIPGSVKAAGKHAFAQCDSLKSALIYEGLTSIPEGMFHTCVALEEVAIPDSVEEIGMAAFYECTALESVVIPHNVRKLGAYAFAHSSALSSAVFKGDAAELEFRCFLGCADAFTVHYPADASGWTTPEWEGYPCYPQ